jgi:DNA-3-methyladenine glycosylase
VTGLRDVGELARFDRRVLEVDAPTAARRLLGAVLVRTPAVDDGEPVLARIVETEAYREDDPASHSYRGRTARCAPMFAPAGTAYVYRSYGVHWCLNVSVEDDGTGAAVLLRAGIVLAGLASVRRRRSSARSDRQLLRGPGCLTAGLDVDGPRHDGRDLIGSGGGLGLVDDGWRPSRSDVVAGPRVGVRLAADLPWRFHLRGVAEVSAYRSHPKAALRTTASPRRPRA